MVLKRLRYYAIEFYFPWHKNTDSHYMTTGKINLYWVTPTFDREPLFLVYFLDYLKKLIKAVMIIGLHKLIKTTVITGRTNQALGAGPFAFIIAAILAIALGV